MNQERMACKTLELFRSIWCERADGKAMFNCNRCEFEQFDDGCVVKRFINKLTPKEETHCGFIKESED